MKWHLEEKEEKSNKGEHNLFKGMFLLTGHLEVKSTLAQIYEPLLLRNQTAL